MYPSTVQVDDSLWDYLLSLHEGSEERAVEDAYNLQVGSHPSHLALVSDGVCQCRMWYHV